MLYSCPIQKRRCQLGQEKCINLLGTDSVTGSVRFTRILPKRKCSGYLRKQATVVSIALPFVTVNSLFICIYLCKRNAWKKERNSQIDRKFMVSKGSVIETTPASFLRQPESQRKRINLKYDFSITDNFFFIHVNFSFWRQIRDTNSRLRGRSHLGCCLCRDAIYRYMYSSHKSPNETDND